MRHALALGALQGPTELLPVSSSGHLTLVPALLGWSYTRLDPDLRKAYEVALHAGAGAALGIVLRGEVLEVTRDLDRRRAVRLALTFVPPAAAGVLIEQTIEERLGTPAGVAAAQVVAGLALAAADRRMAARVHEDAGPVDGVLIGLAQAAALAPGVSRNGATLTAARLRRFDRRSANRLSRHAALPLTVGAAALKGHRLARHGLPAGLAAPFAAGTAAAFASTLACSRLVGLVDGARSYAGFAAYRVTLGALAWSRLHRRAA